MVSIYGVGRCWACNLESAHLHDTLGKAEITFYFAYQQIASVVYVLRTLCLSKHVSRFQNLFQLMYLFLESRTI